MPGRPKNKAFDELGFTLLKTQNKSTAYCTLCNRILKNTAEKRLRIHRNSCKPSPVTANFDSSNVTENLHDIGLVQSFSQPNYNQKIPVCPENVNENDNKNVYIEKVENPQNTHSFNVPATFLQENSPSDIKPEIVGETSSAFLSTSSSLALTAASYNENQKQLKHSSSPCSVSRFTNGISNKEEDELNNSLCNLVYGSNIPFKFLESIHFKNFINILRPTYKIPNRKQLSTTLLDDAYSKCILSKKNSFSSESVLLIKFFKNLSTNTKTMVSVLISAEREQTFLQACHLTDESETKGKNLTNILLESMDIAKKSYLTEIYAVVCDYKGTMKIMDTNEENFVWHSSCSSHIANLFAKDIIKSLTNINNKVALVLNQFKEPHLERMIINQGGSKIVLPFETEWRTYRDSYKSLVQNYDILKSIAVESTIKKIDRNIASLIFVKQFIDDVKCYIEVFDSLYNLIERCQELDCSAGEAVNLWLSLKLPDRIKEEHESSFQSRLDLALNQYALSAYYLNPQFDNNKLTAAQNEVVYQFLFKHLNNDGIEDWDCFNRKINFFQLLYEKDIKKPIVFWNMAAMKHPNLSSLALKLLVIPASSAHIEKVFSSWSQIHSVPRDRLAFERFKKKMHLYYSLRIEDEQCDQSDEDD